MPNQKIADRFEVISTLGVGGMGVVYKAHDPHLQKDVALKVLSRDPHDDELLVRFQREAKAASTLNHPNIVNVYDFAVTDDGEAFMVMDFVDGEDLKSYIESKGALDMESVCHLFSRIASALHHAHEEKVVHRDIKPHNILLISEDGELRPVIVDFGIAKFKHATQSETLTQKGQLIGSPLYMSPEQARGEKVDHRSDIYSLGCVLYEVLCGSPPLFGETVFDTLNMHIEKNPPPVKESAPDLPDDLGVMIDRMLRKDPEERPQSMQEVESCLRNSIVPPAPVPVLADLPTEQQKKGLMDNPLFLASATVLAVCVLVTGIWMTRLIDTDNIDRPPEYYSTTRDGIPRQAESEVAGQVSFHNIDDADGGRYKQIELRYWDNVELKEVVDKDAVKFSSCGYKITENLVQQLRGDLKTFSADNMGITAEGFRAICQLEDLRLLELTTCHLLEGTNFEDISRLKELRKLRLGRSAITNENLIHIATLKELRSLDLSRNNDIDDRHIPLLVKNCRAIESLHLSDTGVTGASLDSIARMPHLTRLEISRLPVGDDDLAAFARRTTRLFKLDIEKTGISGVGLSHIVQVKSLGDLNISACDNISDKDLRLLENTSIDRLDMSSMTKITDTGMKSILRMPELITLNVEGCPGITRKGLAPVYSMMKERFSNAILETSIDGLALKDKRPFVPRQ